MLSQDKRMIQVSNLIGPDALVATAIHGEEHLSKPYHYQVSLLSDNHQISQCDLVGKPITVNINHADKVRYITGHITHLALHDVNNEGLRAYTAVIKPGLWFMSLAGKNRIFEKKTADKIIEEVLSEYGSVLQYSFTPSADYIEREYCVQFNETDFQFIHRIMSEEGITYYFEHSKNACKMVICDDNGQFSQVIKKEIEYDCGGTLPTKNSISSWHREFNYHSGGIELKDYSEFSASKDNIQVVKTTTKLNDVSNYVHCLYGLNHFTSDTEPKHKFIDGYHEALAKRAMESQELRFDTGHGTSDCAEFSAGINFRLRHSLSSETGNYLITSLRITAVDSNTEDSSFKNSFCCIPKGVMPRPDPLARSNQIHAPQIAQVVSVKATSSDSSSDSYTQVKVKFPWNSSQNSCWVRVMQSFAGKSWGANFVPRVGQEVVINYINGDPDRPLVTGAVYNGDNPGPNFNATQSGWKTQFESSSFNQLRFDDKKGNEEIYMEAGKDHNYLVHNDQSGKIENNQTLEVKKDRTITISEGDDSKTLAKGDHSITVSKGNHTLELGQGNHSLKVDKGTQTTDVMGAVKITSKTSIELEVGGNSIKIGPSGITIKGTMLSCQGTAKAEVKAGAMLTLKGGVTMIN